MNIIILRYDKEIHHNFVKGYLTSSLKYGILYDADQQKRKLLLAEILQNFGAFKISVAVDIQDAKSFVGFCIAEDTIVPRLRYIYVKKHSQKQGVGRRLLQATIDLVIDSVEVPVKSPDLNIFFKKMGIKPQVRFFDVIKREL
jgi:GNAT superfamily N-acetyltransferase